MSFEQLISNVQVANTRYDKLEGVDHIVVPMVMMKVGVLAGSHGPLLYNEEEMSKTPEVWDHKPVVVYHPKLNGKPISACKPDVLNTRKIGVVLNTHYEDQRLKAEAWINPERAKIVDNRVWEAIEKKEMMELSTGLFTDTKFDSGEYGGRAYEGITQNYRPDHLALLPDEVGACSISDGAGFLRVNQMIQQGLAGSLSLEELKVLVGNESMVPFLLRNASGLSHEDIRRRLMAKVNATFPLEDPWIVDVFDGYFILGARGKLFRVSYTKESSSVSIGSTQVEVVPVTTYKEVTTANEEEETMADQALLDQVKANAKLTDAEVQAIANAPNAVIQKLIDNAKQPAPPAPQTLSEVVAGIPEKFRPAINSGLQLHDAKRQELVAKITGIEGSKFTPEMLANKELSELDAMASLIRDVPNQPAQNGQAQPQNGQPQQTQNGQLQLGQNGQPQQGQNGQPLQNDYSAAGGAPVDNEGVESPLPLPRMSFADAK